MPDDEEIKKTSKAKEGFERINRIFELEREFKELSKDERFNQRQKQTKPVLDGFYAWLETINLIQGSGLAKAVQNAKNEKKYLYAFLENPDISIDNNLAERTVKPFVIGRKNWLFSTSTKGAEASAVIYSIISTAEANGLNPRDDLTEVFNHPGRVILPLISE